MTLGQHARATLEELIGRLAVTGGRMRLHRSRLALEVDSLQTGILGAARDAAALGDRATVDLLEVTGEVDGAGLADVASDGERVDRSAGVAKDTDALDVDPTRDDDPHRRMPRLVESRANLLHELRGDPSAFRRGVEADAPQAVTQRIRDAQRLL